MEQVSHLNTVSYPKIEFCTFDAQILSNDEVKKYFTMQIDSVKKMGGAGPTSHLGGAGHVLGKQIYDQAERYINQFTPNQ